MASPGCNSIRPSPIVPSSASARLGTHTLPFRRLEWLISRIFTFSANRKSGPGSDPSGDYVPGSVTHRTGHIVKRARIESWCVQIPTKDGLLPWSGCARGGVTTIRRKKPMDRCRAVISTIIRILSGGIAVKVAKLWQVICFLRDFGISKIVLRSATGLDLHPAGLEPATL
jgi:hypothetical protein